MNAPEKHVFQCGKGRVMAKKKIKKDRLKQQKKKKAKPIQNGTSPIFHSSFLKTWLLEPHTNYSARVLMALSAYNLSFKERYTKILYFNKISELEKNFWTKLNPSPKKYMPTQTDCFKAFYANQALRWAFKKLLLAWKLRKVILVNEEDIITLEKPKYPIYIYDLHNKKKYQLEAKSFLVDSVNRFLLHDDFFPKSLSPRNLFTNQELSFGALWSIHNQLKKYGVTHWSWEAFVQSCFQISPFVLNYEIPLKYEMVKRCFQDSTSIDANWYTQELILANAEGLVAKSLKWAVYNQPTNCYMLKWRAVCHDYWKIAVRSGEVEAENNIHIRTRIYTLLDDTQSINFIKDSFCFKTQ